VTTTGRRTGRPHEIEIWFAMREDRSALYLLSGGRDHSDWVRNVVVHPEVTVRLGSRGGPEIAARGRVVTDPEEDALARDLLLEKYRPRYSGGLSGWGQTSLPVAIEPVLWPERTMVNT
jgi:deazaflavin-dependent oxidoreductase (nitroreductase family)